MVVSGQSNFDFTTLADFAVQFLAVAYGVFATATDFKETSEDGKKRLSKTGEIGIAFLIIISIASIGVKIYQHAKDSKTKADAQAAQQKMVRELEQSLSDSKAMNSALADANAKLTSQTGLMTHEADILERQTAQMGGLMLGTKRVLDPLDDSFRIQIREYIKRSEPDLEPYLHRIGSPESDQPTGQNWPKEEDGDFGSYVNSRIFEIRVYPISELAQVVYPKRYLGPLDYQLHLEVVCAAPDKQSSLSIDPDKPPPSIEFLQISGDEVRLVCQVDGLHWIRGADIRSYVDLKNSFMIVSPSTPVWRLGTLHDYAPPLKLINVDISGKNHFLSSAPVAVTPCPLRDPETCYISHMPSD